MRGRKPTPTHLKLIAGNPGKRPLNKREPQFSQEIPECPLHLDAVAQEEWNRVAPELHRNHLLTAADRAALAAYCQAWSRWVEATQKVQQMGLVVLINQTKDRKTGEMKGGQPAPNPYLRIAERASAELRAYLVEFGMSPSSRSRVAVPKKGTTNRFSAL